MTSHAPHVLHGSSRADLLAIPAVLLGFHPQDSCVVLGLRGHVVEFCLRVDSDWCIGAAGQLPDAAAQGDCRFIILGYGALDAAGRSVLQAVKALGQQNILVALAADGELCWDLIGASPPEVCLPGDSSIVAQAAYQGRMILGSREEAVAYTEVWHEPTVGQVQQVLAAAAHRGDPMMRARDLASCVDPIPDDEAVELALLLADDDLAVAMMMGLRRDTVPRQWPNLLAARRKAPREALPNTMAVLAMAAWIGGMGAVTTSCLRQLADLDPTHPMAGVITRFRTCAVPPWRWKMRYPLPGDASVP